MLKHIVNIVANGSGTIAIVLLLAYIVKLIKNKETPSYWTLTIAFACIGYILVVNVI